MEGITSFSQRRPAAGSLPAFSLPPPNAEIPRTTDGLSPSLSSVHTGGSQTSQHHQGMHSYTFGGSMHNNSNNAPMQGGASGAASWSGSWSNHSNYPPGQQPLPSSPYARQSISSSANGANTDSASTNSMAFSNPRTTQSPAGPDGLAPPPFDQSQQQHYVTHNHHSMATGASHHQSLMATASQPPSQSPLTAHSDGFAHAYAHPHTRPGSNPSYYATSGPSQFSSYPPAQHSPTHSSPTTGSPGARGISSLPNNLNYRYGAYSQSLPGTVMSNMHHPGGQMSMIPGMSHHGYGSQMVYPNHAGPQQSHTERPFKCDQCVQSFSRNHDLKRHKRIHLDVKPFPCNYCSKSFSRKDALKRHRLVKGCENRTGDQNAETTRRQGERERD
ncbi:C2H2 finger domain [Cordyceps militaris]|uniref:C2H2 finger domain n=1 Tax=Cordyceps militaris TaxID=73501 RepID=A0A2H4SDV4_CORMI|nr:C2H2 finger domain [Cordyceps militaris]